MATIDHHPTPTSAPALHDRAHLRPLDSLHNALEEAHCRWCRAWLWVLRRHLEKDIPVYRVKGGRR